MSMEKLIADIDRDAIRKTFNEKPETLVEFAERVSPFTLSTCQKMFLEKYEQAQKEGKVVVCMPPLRSGKQATLKIVDEWNVLHALQEYRCSCGRLLGKFSGRAEVKCPKCGKVNEIGFSGGKE